MMAIPGYVREPGPGDEWAQRHAPAGTRVVIVDEFARGIDTMWTRISRPRQCRFTVGPAHKACGRDAVLGIRRGTTKQIWGYCSEHLYGRRWDPATGRLLASILVREEQQP